MTARAESALYAIDPNCVQGDWFKYLCAAKDGGIEYEAANNWSRSADNYESEKSFASTWKSISPGAIKVATLFAEAFKQGWKDSDPSQRQIEITRPTTITAPVKATPVVANAKAMQVWDLCAPATASHPYIARKNGIPDGLRVYPATAPELVVHGKSVAGWLAVPAFDNGKLQTVQFVPGVGDKLNLAGASINGGYLVIGEIKPSGRLYVVEGIGQAWACYAATGDAAVVCFGAGRMAKIATSLRSLYPQAHLVIVPDAGKESQAGTIAASVSGVWCPMPEGSPSNFDVNDFSAENGKEALATLLGHTKAPPLRYKLLSGAELRALPPLTWIVRGVLPRSGLAALYGPSGSGKSFLVLDMAAAIADGDADWFGRRVTQCPVTYCVLEGEGGMAKRVAAWCLHSNKPEPAALRFLTEPVSLLNTADVEDLAKVIQSVGGTGGLTILDTLNRAAPGADENSSIDMGLIIAAAKQLQTLTGGMVLLVGIPVHRDR